MSKPVVVPADTSVKTREIICHRLGAVMSRAACKARQKRAKEMIHNQHFQDCRECGGKNIAAVEEVKTLSTIGTCEVCGKENMTLPSRVKGKKVCGFCWRNLPPALELGVPFDVAEEEIKLKRHLAAPGNKIRWSWNERPEDKVDSECKKVDCNHYNSFSLSGCDMFPCDELSLCKLRLKTPKASTVAATEEKVSGECSEAEAPKKTQKEASIIAGAVFVEGDFKSGKGDCEYHCSPTCHPAQVGPKWVYGCTNKAWEQNRGGEFVPIVKCDGERSKCEIPDGEFAKCAPAESEETQASTEKASDKIGDIPGFKSVTLKSDAGHTYEEAISSDQDPSPEESTSQATDNQSQQIKFIPIVLQDRDADLLAWLQEKAIEDRRSIDQEILAMLDYLRDGQKERRTA